MTGRELIILILENNLEDKPIIELCTLFETMDQTAERLGVGIATVDTWFRLGQIKGITLGEITYIFKNAMPEKEG